MNKYISILGEKVTINNIYKNKKVLVGDYNEITRDLTSNILKSFSIKVYELSSSSDILKKIKSGKKYDLIITNNIYKDDMDGLTLLKELKNIENFSTPIIITTIDKNRDYYINLGFDEYINKPLDIEKVKKVLNNIFK